MPYEFDVRYIREETAAGNRYTFFCGLSGAAVHTTGLIHAADPQAELMIAKAEARLHFNRCEECGKWIGDAAYNIDEGKCVVCAPFTVKPSYCAECGRPIRAGSNKCVRCGFKITAQRIGKGESA